MKHSRHFIYRFIIIGVCLWFIFPMMAFSGKHPYQDTRPISYNIIEILKKHGMAVNHNHENRWYKISSGSTSWIGGDPVTTIYLYETQDIPSEAQLEIIKFCISLYKSKDHQGTIRLEMRTEKFNPEILKPEPYIEFIINKK